MRKLPFVRRREVRRSTSLAGDVWTTETTIHRIRGRERHARPIHGGIEGVRSLPLCTSRNHAANPNAFTQARLTVPEITKGCTSALHRRTRHPLHATRGSWLPCDEQRGDSTIRSASQPLKCSPHVNGAAYHPEDRRGASCGRVSEGALPTRPESRALCVSVDPRRAPSGVWV